MLHFQLIKNVASCIAPHFQLIRNVASCIVLHFQLIRNVASCSALHLQLNRNVASCIALHFQLIRSGGGGGGLIATRFSEDNRFTDALGVNGEGRVGDQKVVLTTPTTRGVSYPCVIAVCGVGGKAGGTAYQSEIGGLG